MLYALTYLILLTALGTLTGLLLRVTYPPCTHTRCAEHTGETA